MFKNTISEFADRYALSTWDWSAIIIALSSLLIAIISLLIAYRTLISQKETQKNTTPILNQKIQLYLLTRKLRNLYESFVFLNTLGIILDTFEKPFIPSMQFWDYVRINNSDLHLDLFYNEDDKFKSFYILAINLERYNSDVEYFVNILKDRNSTHELKFNYISHLLDQIYILIQLWANCYSSTFNLTDTEIFKIIEENFVYCKKCSFETVYQLSENTTLNSDREFTKYFLGNSFVKSHLSNLTNNFYYKLRKYFNNIKKWPFDAEKSIDLLSKYIELILLNSLYNFKPLASFLIVNSEDNNKGNMNLMINNSNNFEPVWGINEEESKVNFSKESISWIFFIKDI